MEESSHAKGGFGNWRNVRTSCMRFGWGFVAQAGTHEIVCDVKGHLCAVG